jgi:uncharacterized protein (UPF0548 family)
MLLLHKPTTDEIDRAAVRAATLAFTSPTGLLALSEADSAPGGWFNDAAEAVIGEGPHDYAAARQAIIDLVPFRQPWLETFAPNGVTLDAAIGIQVQFGPLWSVNWSRVIEVVDTSTNYSFVYSTTTDHGEVGEERFAVSMAADGVVSYRVSALSRPGRSYTVISMPYVRHLQAKFRSGSIAAMRAAVGTACVS